MNVTLYDLSVAISYASSVLSRAFMSRLTLLLGLALVFQLVVLLMLFRRLLVYLV